MKCAALLVALIAAPVRTQQPEDVDTRSAGELALAAMRQLELPLRRYEAGAELWHLGSHAVTALASGFDDPRPEIVATYLAVLRFLPIDDPAVLDQVKALQRSSNRGVALRAFECVIAQAHRDKVVVHDFDQNWIGYWDGEAVHKVHNWPDTTYDGDMLAEGGAVGTSGGQLLRLAADGTAAWTLASDAAIDIDPMPGGRYLVAARGTHNAYEVDTEGTVHWEFQLDGMRAVEAERLTDGRTLVSDHRMAQAGGGVHVVDAAGELLTTLACDKPSDAAMMADGAIVAALRPNNEIVIFEADGTVRVRFGTGGPVADLQELPDGTLLAAKRTLLVRYDQTGAVIGRSELAVGLLSSVRLMAGGPLPETLPEPEPPQALPPKDR